MHNRFLCGVALRRPELGLHTHTFNGPLSGSPRVSRYQKGKTNLDFTGARDSEWQWHQLSDRQVRVVPDKGPINVCVCVHVCVRVHVHVRALCMPV